MVQMKSARRVYSTYGMQAMQLFGKMIRQARLDRKMTAEDLAERASISRTTLSRIENGDMKVEVGLVFEVAFIAGVRLFNHDAQSMQKSINQIDDRLALIPKYARKPVKALHDNF